MFDYNYRIRPNTVADGEWVLWVDLIDKSEEIPAKAIP